MEQIPLPKAFTDLLPPALQPYALLIAAGGVAVVAILGLIFLLLVAKLLFGGKGGKKRKAAATALEEDLTEYPDLKPSTGDRQLRVEGVPVRLRLVVVAPAGTSEVDLDELADVLEKIVPGLGEIYKTDKPRVKEWPKQVSYQGFATHFHRCMLTGAEEGEQTRWVMVAGRVKVGKQQIMLGVVLQSIKPNTVGRRTVDSHEWATVLRVRVRE